MTRGLASDITVAGGGNGARALAAGVARARGARIAAFVGGERAREAAAPYGAVVHGTVDEALAGPRGTLAVCTPTHRHVEHAARAVAAGWDVLVDKPLALSIGEADALVRAAADADVVLGAVHQYRCDPAHAFVARALAGGEIGAVRHLDVRLEARRPPAYYAASPWRADRRTGGGVVWNQAFHLWDLVAWWLGPVGVGTAAISGSPTLDEDVTCELCAGSGATASVVATTSSGAAHALSLELRTDAARIHVRDHWRASWHGANRMAATALDRAARETGVNTAGYHARDAYAALLEAAVGGRLVASAPDAVAAVELAGAIDTRARR